MQQSIVGYCESGETFHRNVSAGLVNLLSIAFTNQFGLEDHFDINAFSRSFFSKSLLVSSTLNLVS